MRPTALVSRFALRALLGLLAGLTQITSAHAQCSLCRDAVAASPLETREAMNYAIIGLAFAPYGIGVLGAYAASPRLRNRIRMYLRSCKRFKTGESA